MLSAMLLSFALLQPTPPAPSGAAEAPVAAPVAPAAGCNAAGPSSGCGRSRARIFTGKFRHCHRMVFRSRCRGC